MNHARPTVTASAASRLTRALHVASAAPRPTRRSRRRPSRWRRWPSACHRPTAGSICRKFSAKATASTPGDMRYAARSAAPTSTNRARQPRADHLARQPEQQIGREQPQRGNRRHRHRAGRHEQQNHDGMLNLLQIRPARFDRPRRARSVHVRAATRPTPSGETPRYDAAPPASASAPSTYTARSAPDSARSKSSHPMNPTVTPISTGAASVRPRIVLVRVREQEKRTHPEHNRQHVVEIGDARRDLGDGLGVGISRRRRRGRGAQAQRNGERRDRARRSASPSRARSTRSRPRRRQSSRGSRDSRR